MTARNFPTCRQDVICAHCIFKGFQSADAHFASGYMPRLECGNHEHLLSFTPAVLSADSMFTDALLSSRVLI
jgi:hypothetical protein